MSSRLVACWTIMINLESTKGSFLFCLVISVFICAVIYLNAKNSGAPKAVSNDQSSDAHKGLSGNQSHRILPENCLVLLNGAPNTRWARTDFWDVSYFDSLLDCSRMQADLHFIMEPLSGEEEAYPLAFIITIHKELELFVRLLRAIYSPHNVYCVHVDAKAPDRYKATVRRLARCFPNVLLASVSERVVYAGFSRLQADINCMKDLVKAPMKWRKVINLCGQDFPLMSNLELVRYLQAAEWKDKNMTPGIKQPKYMRYRTHLQHEEVDGNYVASKGQKKEPPPHNLEIYFGTAYYALTRAFVEYVLNSSVATDLLEWSRDTFSPDEHYWVTLNHLKDVPGSNTEGGWEGSVRAIKWRDQEGTAHQGCKGYYVRDICIYSLEDLPWIIKTNNMFANKFESATFPEALDCLEQWHRLKVLQQAKVPRQQTWHLATQVNISNSSVTG